MGKNLEGLKKAIENVAGKEAIGNTKGEVLENLAKQYEEVLLTIAVVDASGDAIASPTVTLKTGETVGSGDTVSAGADGYSVVYGKYNYSVAKSDYVTKTGVIEIDFDDVKAGEKEVSVTLEAEPDETPGT